MIRTMKCSMSLLLKAAEDSANGTGITARMVLGPLIVRGLFRLKGNDWKKKNKFKYASFNKRQAVL